MRKSGNTDSRETRIVFELLSLFMFMFSRYFLQKRSDRVAPWSLSRSCGCTAFVKRIFGRLDSRGEDPSDLLAIAAEGVAPPEDIFATDVSAFNRRIRFRCSGKRIWNAVRMHLLQRTCCRDSPTERPDPVEMRTRRIRSR